MALNHTATGSVNYTVVGTPTIVDGVVSGFTTSDYISVPVTINQATDDWDFVLDITSNQTEISGGLFTFGAKFRLIVQGTSSSNRIRMNLRNAEDSDNVWVQTPYFDHPFVGLVRVVKSGTTVSIYTKETTDTGWVEQASSSNLSLLNTSFSTVYYGIYSKPASSPFPGSINLNNTYIKVNGQALFGVCPVEVKHINYGTSVGYTKVGSPTISNGVASNFSNSNYLSITSSFSPNTSDFEIGTEVKTGDISSNQRIISDSNASGTNTGLTFYSTDKHFRFRVYDSTSSLLYNIDSSLIVSANSNYAIKAYRQGTTLAISVSADGTNWITDTIDLPATASFSDVALLLGQARNFTFSGSINLNKTYVKIKGKLWFYRPCTNYLVKDGKLVFADSRLYIEESGVRTYATQNLAPVPSGYTYGNTTTSAIGYVDMRTQAFTAVPGATWGKEE